MICRNCGRNNLSDFIDFLLEVIIGSLVAAFAYWILHHLYWVW